MKKGVVKIMSFAVCLGMLSSLFGCSGKKETSDVSGYAASQKEQTVKSLELPSVFANGMILQRDKKINIYGVAVNGNEVTVTFDGKAYKTTAHEKTGAFIVELPAQKASFDTHTVTVESAGAKKEFTDVLIGEVFLCGGQSNMELPMNWDDTYQDYYLNKIPTYDENQYIKQFLIEIGGAPAEQFDCKSLRGWESATHANLPTFSPLAYYFAREAFASLNIPIGLVMGSAGATGIQYWISRDDQKDVKYDTFNSQYQSRGTYYNSMIAPVLPYTYSAVLWYQGCANADFREFTQYIELQQILVNSWRRELCDSGMPFFICELAGINDDRFTLIRQSQQAAVSQLSDVYLVPNYDLGDFSDLHPRHKDELAVRIFKMYEGYVLGKDTEYKAPTVKNIEISGNTATVTFDNVYSGLKTKDGKDEVVGFFLAGEDKRYYDAKATITAKDTVTVTCDKVSEIATLRYAYKGHQEWNLVGGNDIAPLMFRTDDWELKVNKGANKLLN